MKVPKVYQCGAFANILGLLWVLGCGSFAGNPEGGESTPPKEQTTPPGSGPNSPGGGGSSSTTTGAITFSLTDAPIKDVRSVFVTAESLEVSLSDDDGTWIKIPLTAATEVDLMQLQSGKTTPLGAVAELAPGTYKQTRLKLAPESEPRLVELDGTEHPLTIPSAVSSGIKIMTEFTIAAGESLNMTIDFDLRKSIKLNNSGSGNGNGNGNSGSGNGNSQRKYKMNPVLRLVRDDDAGAITGSGDNGEVVCVYRNGKAKDDIDDCDEAEASAVVLNGKFHVAFIPSGKYEVRIFSKAGDSTRDLGDVTVKTGESTNVDADGDGTN